jgi:O-antigen ligase
MFDLLLVGTRLALLSLLVLFPWFFGGTDVVYRNGFALALAGTGLVWLAAHAGFFRFPSIHYGPLIAGTGLLVLGWLAALHPSHMHDAATGWFIPLDVAGWNGPAAMDGTRARTVMIHITGVILALWMACDMGREARWRRVALAAILLSGTLLAAWGLWQRMAGAPAIYWMPADHGRTFFATFRYHGHAGAFLAFHILLAACLVLRDLERGAAGRTGVRFYGICLFTLTTALLVNSSRLSQGAVFLGLLAVGLAAGIHWLRTRRLREVTLFLPGALVLLLVAAMLVGVEQSWTKLQGTMDDLDTLNGRLPAYAVWLRAVEDAGWFGFGPGLFPMISGYYTPFAFGRVPFLQWNEAHQDYLQTWIEWGAAGFVLWGMLVLSCLAAGVVAWRRQDRRDGSRWEIAGLAAATGVVLLVAMADFPLQAGGVAALVMVALGLLAGCSYRGSFDEETENRAARPLRTRTRRRHRGRDQRGERDESSEP